MRRFASRNRRKRLLAGTASRIRGRQRRKARTAATRVRRAHCDFRYHPEASEDFLILPSSLFLSPRRGRLALGLPRFGSSFGSVIPRERPITFQLAFQNNRLMFFEN